MTIGAPPRGGYWLVNTTFALLIVGGLIAWRLF